MKSRLLAVLGLSLSLLGPNQWSNSPDTTIQEKITQKESDNDARNEEILEEKIKSITDTEGNPIFNEKEIPLVKFCIRDNLVPIESLKSFGAIKDKDGNRLFNAEEIFFFSLYGGTVSYAKELSDAGFNGQSIYRFKLLDIKPGNIINFKDTKKPNAVILYSAMDFVAFHLKENAEFYKKIEEKYDTWVRVVSTEQEVYKAIGDIPNIELLVLGGHGRPTKLALGEKAQEDNNEIYTIDTSDHELGKYLQKLNPNVVIFLISCSSGKGGKEADNLANFVINAANERKVVSSMEEFSIFDINLVTLYPFNARIIGAKEHEISLFGKKIVYHTFGDKTYTNKDTLRNKVSFWGSYFYKKLLSSETERKQEA